jgi:hypothetical protein
VLLTTKAALSTSEELRDTVLDISIMDSEELRDTVLNISIMDSTVTQTGSILPMNGIMTYRTPGN